ncbi:GNAT family N-acetyltransferase [Nocardiopsis suaedae]|uniref:GNAT family N-acetyltransferase n=1 Tax=Nocardiopsis suaedae TaxID=3018444 RepID=A0ABT4TRI0_9ACTN|nr:GNAT family N-acetyltransferase [Nocardiopsis suaedae]MDA2806742.1 GNAT family N-acetyltransferase [Nocardiopsis suaedae]
MDGIEISTDPARIDRPWLWKALTTSPDVYWAKFRTREMFDAQLDAAWRLVGAYEAGTGRMVGFARAASDGAALAYLADVYVDPSARGRGLGRAILTAMIDDGPGRDFRWMLHTDDAHGLYAEFGFAAPDTTYMERRPRMPHVRP